MRRQRIDELMDAPALAVDRHRLALDGLGRINRASGVASQLLGPILRHAAGRRITLLDVASGGADVPIAVATAARGAGVEIALTLFDRSGVGFDRTRPAAMAAGLSVETLEGDAIDALPPRTFDIVTCSLFLHHLDADQAIRVVGNLRNVTAGLLLVSDLRRSIGGLIAAHAACRILSRSDIVHFDGPVSARAAWTIAELRSMAAEAGVADASIRRCWPFRMLLEWKPRE